MKGFSLSLLLGAVLAPEMISAQRATTTPTVVSLDNTCGMINSTNVHCNATYPCCSKYGYCGSTGSYCLTPQGCQSSYSNSTTACTTPSNGVTVTPDGTCGKTGNNTAGYTCKGGAFGTCCSGSGWCGNTTAYCSTANSGCQSTYGTCTT